MREHNFGVAPFTCKKNLKLTIDSHKEGRNGEASMNPVDELVPDTHGTKRINNERRTKKFKTFEISRYRTFLGEIEYL